MPEPAEPELGSELAGLTWVPLRPERINAWHPLLEAIVAADDEIEHLAPEDLEDELSPPWRDLDRDGWIVLDDAGSAVAFGTVDLRPGDRTWLRALCWGGVHPRARGQGIGRRLLAAQLTRAAELVEARRLELGDPAIPGAALIGVSQGATTTPGLLRRAGLRQARLSCSMRRDLADPLPRLSPAAVPVRPYEQAWSESVRLAHNEAFAQHWGVQPWSVETWQQWETGHRDFRPEWSFVAHDRLGVAGYLMSAGHQADWAADGFTQGWTSKIGVRPDRRRQGLGAALLVTAMSAYRDSGMQYAGLDVDAENTTNAVSLYTRLGYVVRHTTPQWVKDL